jgi:hypothetical protein
MQDSVYIAVRDIPGGSPVATAAVRLEDYGLPPEGIVFVEAYRKAAYIREKMGTVGDLPEKFDFELCGFGAADGVKFRIKVTGKRGDSPKDAPILLALADQIAPDDGDEDNSDLDKLLRMVPADLEGEIWRLEIVEEPTLSIDKRYWEDRNNLVRSGWFFSLVLPTICREVLQKALEDNYREIDDEDWRSKWIRFALNLPGPQDFPPPDTADEIRQWVNTRVEAFCRNKHIPEHLATAMKGGL